MIILLDNTGISLFGCYNEKFSVQQILKLYLYLSNRSSATSLATQTLSINIRIPSDSVVLKCHLKSSP